MTAASETRTPERVTVRRVFEPVRNAIVSPFSQTTRGPSRRANEFDAFRKPMQRCAARTFRLEGDCER